MRNRKLPRTGFGSSRTAEAVNHPEGTLKDICDSIKIF